MCNFVLLGYNSCCLYHDLYRWRTRTKFGERAFSYAGPAVWNLLPDDLRRTPTINSFKRKLKTYLFISAFSWFYFSFFYYVLTFVLHRCPYFCNRRTINYLWYDMIWYACTILRCWILWMRINADLPVPHNRALGSSRRQCRCEVCSDDRRARWTLARPVYTGWDKKYPTVFEIEKRVICQNFQIVSRMKCLICISVQLNILCLICMNRPYPQNCIEFDNDAWILLNFHSKYSKTRTISNTWLVQTKFNMITICLDNYRQSFWQLINRSVQCVHGFAESRSRSELASADQCLKFCDDTPSCYNAAHTE